MRRKIKTFIGNCKDVKFGDYLLFQEYTKHSHDGEQYSYEVSRPILGIYLGCFVADQTLGFNYVKWINENHTVYITNEHVKNYPVCKEVSGIESHIEWDDYLDILGHWKERPGWKEIIKCYREQNEKEIVKSEEIEWERE